MSIESFFSIGRVEMWTYFRIGKYLDCYFSDVNLLVCTCHYIVVSFLTTSVIHDTVKQYFIHCDSDSSWWNISYLFMYYLFLCKCNVCSWSCFLLYSVHLISFLYAFGFGLKLSNLINYFSSVFPSTCHFVSSSFQNKFYPRAQTNWASTTLVR